MAASPVIWEPLGPRIIGRDLFSEVDGRLIALLTDLAPDDWHRPTVCSQWSVKDIASHLLDGGLRRLSLQRDRHVPRRAPAGGFDSHAELVRYLGKLNADWTAATDRLSPRVVLDLLTVVLPQATELLASLDPSATALFPVAWAGETESQNWMDVAREFTERWHHQQQIAVAVGRSGGITSRKLYHPVLETFLRGLPYTLQDMERPIGTSMRVSILGDAGGDWYVYRSESGWSLTEHVLDAPAATASVPQDAAWLMFTKRWDRRTKRARFPDVRIEGDAALGDKLLDVVSIMA